VAVPFLGSLTGPWLPLRPAAWAGLGGSLVGDALGVVKADPGRAGDGGGRFSLAEAAGHGGLLEARLDLGVVEQPAGDIAEKPQPGPVQRLVALPATRWGAGDSLTLAVQGGDGIRVVAAGRGSGIGRGGSLGRGRLQQSPQRLGHLEQGAVRSRRNR
jgi:hypothetical protein